MDRLKLKTIGDFNCVIDLESGELLDNEVILHNLKVFDRAFELGEFVIIDNLYKNLEIYFISADMLWNCFNKEEQEFIEKVKALWIFVKIEEEA